MPSVSNCSRYKRCLFVSFVCGSFWGCNNIWVSSDPPFLHNSWLYCSQFTLLTRWNCRGRQYFGVLGGCDGNRRLLDSVGAVGGYWWLSVGIGLAEISVGSWWHDRLALYWFYGYKTIHTSQNESEAARLLKRSEALSERVAWYGVSDGYEWRNST